MSNCHEPKQPWCDQCRPELFAKLVPGSAPPVSESALHTEVVALRARVAELEKENDYLCRQRNARVEYWE